MTAEALMGYTPSRQGWVRFFANGEGQSFAIRMIDTGNGWTWKYVTFFKRTTPKTPEPDATFTKKSVMEYSIDGPRIPKMVSLSQSTTFAIGCEQIDSPLGNVQ